MKGDRAAPDPLGGGLRDVRVQIETGDARALARENLGDAEPETLPRACHQGGFACKTHARLPLLLRLRRLRRGLRLLAFRDEVIVDLARPHGGAGARARQLPIALEGRTPLDDAERMPEPICEPT